MLKRLVIYVAALFLSVGVLSTVTSTGYAGPGQVTVGMTPIPADFQSAPLIKIGQCGSWNNWCGGKDGKGDICGPWNNWCKGGGNCGPWNNWCHGGGSCGPWNNWCSGGASACVNFGGVQFCVGNPGSDCRWYHGRKYCSVGYKKCIWYHDEKYCTYRKGGDCIWRNGRRYCTGW